MAYMKDSSGRRLDSFEVLDTADAVNLYQSRNAFRSTSLLAGGGLISSRSGNPGSAAGLSNGTDTSATTRIKHKAFTDIADVRFLYNNIANGAKGPNDITVKASVELADGTILQASFNGLASATIRPGAYVVSDPLPLPPAVATGVVFWSRTHVSVASVGMKWPLNVVSSNSNEGVVVNTDSVASGTIANSFTNTYGPQCLFGGTVEAKPAVAAIGDSICAGQGDSSHGDGTDYGFIQRGLHDNTVAYLTVAKPGETASQFVAPAVFSLRFVPVAGCTHAICEYGINDVNSGRTLAQIQADNLNLWRALASRQIKAFQTTITPSSTSSNTVPAVNDSVRVAYNTWLRAGAPIDPVTKVAVAVGTGGALLAGTEGHPLEGYFEIADLAETARNSGLWKAGYSGDGTHPNAVGHAAIALGIDTTRITVS